MHHIHQTKGIIIDSFPTGQADRALCVFTEELGLVIANARSIREPRSKLRSHVGNYSELSLSLVRGKAGWRLIGAEVENAWPTLLGIRNEKFILFARVSALLRRLLHGEEAHPELYETLTSALLFLRTFEGDIEKTKSFEALLVLRILHLLGYVGGEAHISKLCESPCVWSADVFGETFNRQELVMHINRALTESHL